MLQSNGDVYACPRGQASTKFRYGNVFDDKVQDILVNGWKTIEILENNKEPSPECYTCEYLPHCHQGCIFVREETGLKKSYTCDLQKAIYRDDPKKYPAYDEDYINSYSKRYQFRNNVQAITIMKSDIEKKRPKNPELYDDKNALLEIINSDPALQAIYSKTAFRVIVDGRSFTLHSPLLSTRRDLVLLNSKSKIELVIHKSMFACKCDDLVNNHLLMMLLRNTMVRYGDEQREKQEHIIDHAIYYQSLVNQHRNTVAETFTESESEDALTIDLTPLFAQWRFHFLPGIRNNLYFSTKTLREYHYQKQRKNAFYHIQAINLPFPFLEFYWSEEAE